MNYFIHNVPGRIRIKIPSIKGNGEMIESVPRLFEDMEGVKNVFVNAVTGSVTINYDPNRVLSEKLLLALREKGYLEEHRVVTGGQAQQQGTAKAGQVVGRAVFGWALGRALEGSGLGILACLI